MKLYRSVWLIILVAGLMFISAALASGASDRPFAGNGEAAPGPIGGNDDPGTSTLAMPDEALSIGSSDDQACRDCHTNQETLQELAVEVEVEDLSEGPG